MEQTMTSSPMEQTMATLGDLIPEVLLATTNSPNIICEACNLHLHPKTYEQHVNGKKHKLKQQQYDQKYKTIFVSGTSELTPQALEKLFKQFGKISIVQKKYDKPFAFIRFVDKDSVERALSGRVFAGGRLLYIRRYNDNRNNPETSIRKLLDTLSKTSQPDGKEMDGKVGLRELPVQLPDLEWCPSEEDVLTWMAQDIISQIELSPEMYQYLDEVKSDVENLFIHVLPGCEAIIFGSCGSTLALKNSDVDLFLQTGSGEQPKDFVRNEAKEMYKCKSQFKVIARIPSARVPIVKFEHLKTGWQGDLTTNSQLGVCNSQLIRFLVSLNPRIRPLIMLIKYWSRVCSVTGNHSRLTTYALVMLVIFYLQQLEQPVLPTVAQLQQMSQHKQYCLGWECSFCDDERRVQTECLPQTSSLSLRQMLTGFFKFYYNFDFENNIICPLLGRSVPIVDFESVDGSSLPDEMFLYKERLISDPNCKFRTKDVYLRVQDPFELSLNITRNVAEGSFVIFKQACKVSLGLCEKESDSTLLKSLFTIDQESLDVHEGYLKIVFPFKEEISDGSETSDQVFVEWYELTTEAIKLVLSQILKCTIDTNNVEVSSKVKKLESSQDVHTPMNNLGDNSVLLCHGNSNVWSHRKKIHKCMNALKISLNDFEREVCISNSLYYPDDKNSFSFTLVMSSLEDSKERDNNIEVKLKMKKNKNPLFNGFMPYMKTFFKSSVLNASAFISNLKSSSPMTEVKESLKELFELKLKNLPDLRNLMKNERKEKSDKMLEKQNLLMRTLGSKPDSTVGENDNELRATLSTDLLKATQKIETKSTFTSGEVNPFLETIEKIAQKSLKVKNKHNEGEIMKEKGEGENIDFKNKEVGANINGEENTATNDKKGESSIRDRVINDQRSNAKMCLQRPKIHSERPLKQKKPGRPYYKAGNVQSNKNVHKAGNAFNRNVPEQQRTWVGGGPPHCKQLAKDRRHPPAIQNPQNKGSERQQQRPFRSIKKCYPELCWEYDY